MPRVRLLNSRLPGALTRRRTNLSPVFPAFCLQCNLCEGEYDCVGEQVTCEGLSPACTTSVRKAAVSFLEFQTVKKGCAHQLYPDESISLNSHLMALTHQALYCDKDNCNNETYFGAAPGAQNLPAPPSAAWGEQDQCLDLDITGNLGQFANMKLKGCANLPRCQETLSFYSESRMIRATCCDSPLCNSFTPDLNLQSEAPNGLECYSCVDEDGSENGCSNQTMSTIQCTGVHNMCLEGVGKSRRGDPDLGLITFKGCASPAMCQSSLLALVQELENTDVLCCQGNLCNTRIIDGMVTEPKIPADSADLSEAHGCIPATTPSGPTPNPECEYADYDDDTIAAAPVPGQASPQPGSHADKEVVDAISGKDNSEINSVGSTGITPAAADGSSATADLHKSESGASSTSSGSHGNVVVLMPIIIPKRNTTTAPASSSSSSSETPSKGDLVASSRDESEADECEAEDDEDDSSEDLAAAPADNTVSSYGFTPRPGPSAASSHGTTNVVAAIGENVIAGGGTPLPAAEHGANSPNPLPYILSRDNESFVIAGEAEMGTTTATHTHALPATNSPSEAAFASGTGVESSPPPKKKIPCKRPRQPGANSGVNNHVAERSVMQDLQLSETKDTGKTHHSSGAFGSAGNLGLLSLSLLLAVLLH
ncbi:hypothetical protein lerEdw1_014219 [Lerista edwardsae]|nr:hypothetical protein lerEdw1_014219 [Lerista edwardsae]